MDLPERLRSALASWAEGEEIVTEAGEGIYRPPGHQARGLGDTIVGLGTVGFVMPTMGATLPGSYAPADPVAFHAFRFLPFLAALPVWMLLLFERWEARAAIAGIGLVATAFTWRWAWEAISPETAGFLTAFLGVGSVLVFVGGTLSTVAMLVGEWAPRILHDTRE